MMDLNVSCISLACRNSYSVHLKWKRRTGMPHWSTLLGSSSQYVSAFGIISPRPENPTVVPYTCRARALQLRAVAFFVVAQIHRTCRRRAYRGRPTIRCDSRAENRSCDRTSTTERSSACRRRRRDCAAAFFPERELRPSRRCRPNPSDTCRHCRWSCQAHREKARTWNSAAAARIRTHWPPPR